MAALLCFGGCAKKAVDATQSPAAPVAAAPSGETAATAGAEAQSQPAPTSSTATLSTQDGSKLETIYFDYDSFTLQPAARQALERNAAWMRTNPTVKVIIEGHCDERGSDEYNLALGERRAMAVKSYLTILGVDGGRVATISYGEERPAVDGHDETTWSKNRRAEFK